MSAYLLKIVQLMKSAEDFKNLKDGDEKKAFVLDKLKNEIGQEKFQKYQTIISELIDTMVFLHNNKELVIFTEKACCSCFG